MRITSVTPGLVIVSVLGLLSLSSSAAAQPAAPIDSKDAALNEVARSLFRQGVKAFEQEQWEQCRAALLAAWNIKKQYQIAGNLAACEAELGLYRDAAAHARYFLKETPKDSPPERKKNAEVLFAELRRKVAMVTISVNVAGAEVFVDGASVGRSPLAEPLFLDPGQHKIEAQLVGFPNARKVLDAPGGSEPEVSIQLQASPEKPVASTTPARQPPASSPSSPAASSEQPRSPLDQPSPPVRKIVIGTGIGTSAVLLGIGIGFLVAWNAQRADLTIRLDGLNKKTGPSPCYVPERNANTSECAELFALRDDLARPGNVAIWSFVGAGVIGAGTLAYALFTPKRSVRSAVQVLPVSAADGAGLVVRGRW